MVAPKKLAASARPLRLRALIVAALSTGCRPGELLSLQWPQVRVDEQGQPRWLLLPASKTKSAQARAVPIGATLRAELAMRTTAPDSEGATRTERGVEAPNEWARLRS